MGLKDFGKSFIRLAQRKWMPYNAWQEFFDKTFPADPKPKARNAVNTKLLRLYALNPKP